jgi:hypothetical protein
VTEVTYFVALPFVAAGDGIAAGERDVWIAGPGMRRGRCSGRCLMRRSRPSRAAQTRKVAQPRSKRLCYGFFRAASASAARSRM